MFYYFSSLLGAYLVYNNEGLLARYLTIEALLVDYPFAADCSVNKKAA